MNRLHKIITASIFLISALLAEGYYPSSALAQSDEARELNRKGVTALESGRYGEAVQLLKQAMALEPKWGEPCFNAARLLRLNNKREEMTKMLRKANGVEPNNAKYAEEYLKVLLEDLNSAEKGSNRSEITRLRNEILRVNPGNLELGLKIVNEHLKLSEKDQALAAAVDLIEKNTRFRFRYDVKEMGELYFVAAQIAFEREELEKAKSYADNAVKYEFAKRGEAGELLREIKRNVDTKVSNFIAEATAAQKAGNYEMAMSLLKKAEELQPENESIKNTMVQFSDDEDANKVIARAERFNADDRWLDARELLINILNKYSENAKAKKMLANMKPKETALLKAIGRPDVPTSMAERKGLLLGFKEIGMNFFEAGNRKAAVEPLKKALALIEADKMLKGYRDEIEEVLEKINLIDENKSTWLAAVEARNAGDYEESLRLLKKLPSDQDEQYDSYLAEAYYKTGDSEKAEKAAISQLGKQPENNRAKFVLGSIYLDAGEVDRAYKYFIEIYNSDSDYPEIADKLAASSTRYAPTVITFVIFILLAWIAWNMKKNLPIYAKNSKINKGISLFKREYYDECIAAFMEVRRSPYLNPADHFDIAKYMAQSYLKKAKYDLAIGECKHLISLAPKNEEAHTWLGYAYLGRRMLSPEALPELLNLYKKDSKNIALVSLLGSYYAQQKNLSDDGVKILEQWLNLDHDNVEVLKPLGKYYLKKNCSDDKAMKVFHKMMEIGSPEPDFMLGVANVYLKLHQFDEALQLCEQVINMDINNEYVHTVLLEAYKRQNRLSELLDIYANFLQDNPYNVAFQNGLRAAQAAYDKIQSRNVAQAANEAAAVMRRMLQANESVQNVSENGELLDTTAQVDGISDGVVYANPDEASYTSSEGMPPSNEQVVACPACGKENQEGAYACLYCGTNMFQ